MDLAEIVSRILELNDAKKTKRRVVP